MCFRWSAFTTMLLHITNDFHGLDLEFYKPRMSAEFRIMIGELYLKSNWTKLKTRIPGDTFIPGRNFSYKWKFQLSQLTKAPGW